MFKPFKAVRLYHIDQEWPYTPGEMQALLEVRKSAGCPPTEPQHRGWVTPYPSDQALLYHQAGPLILWQLQFEKRLLPAQVIQEAMRDELEQMAAEQGHPPSQRQKKNLRETLMGRLLPQAFVQKRQVRILIHTEQRWLAIDASSPAAADQTMASIHKTFPELQLKRYTLTTEPTAWMTQALQSTNGSDLGAFTLAHDCLMVDMKNKQSKIKFNQHHLLDDAVIEHVRDHHEVIELGLQWQEKWQFTLHEDGHLSKIKSLQQDQETDREALQHLDDPLARFDASFVLVTGELQQILTAWQALFVAAQTEPAT